MFEVSRDDVRDLSDSQARELIARLARSDLARVGAATTSVRAGGDQRAADGGIDVDVRIEGGVMPDDGRLRRRTVVQVKHSNFGLSRIAGEMAPNGLLRSFFAELAVSGGKYVIAATKTDIAGTGLGDMIGEMKRLLGNLAVDVDFLDRDAVATWVNEHPPVAAWVRETLGRPFFGWKPHGAWAHGRDALPYILGEDARLVFASEADPVAPEAGLAHLRRVLGTSGEIVRLVGLSGVGKTRLAQALFETSVGEGALPPELVAYADASVEPRPLPEHLAETLVAAERRAILIVDNCTPERHGRLRDIAKGTSVSVLTVEHDVRPDEPEGTEVVRLEPAGEELIREVLGRWKPDLPFTSVERIVRLVDGNFRIAQYLLPKIEVGEDLTRLADRDLFGRLFWQGQDVDRNLERAARSMSLVYSFSVTSQAHADERAELPLLAEIARMSAEAFRKHVAELADRQIVQKRSDWRAVLPPAIAHRLAADMLGHVDTQAVWDRFRDGPARLRGSFIRRIGMLHDVEAARRVAVLQILPWVDSLILDNRAAEGLEALERVAPAVPEDALALVEARVDLIIAPETDGFAWAADRLRILLRSLAESPSIFDRVLRLAQRVMPRLETRRRKKWADLIVQLFAPRQSGTDAPLAQRLRALDRLVASGELSDKLLSVDCVGALFGMAASNFVMPSFGSRGWHPGLVVSRTEWLATWVPAAIERLDMLIAAGRVDERIGSVADHWIERLVLWDCWDTASSLAERMGSMGRRDIAWIAFRRSFIRHSERFDDLSRRRLQELMGRFAPSTLLERIEAAFEDEMNHTADQAMADQLGLDLDATGSFEKVRSARHAMMESLGRDVAGAPALFPAVVTAVSRVKGGFDGPPALGMGLGGAVEAPLAAWKSLQALASERGWESPIVQFLDGFMRAVDQRSHADRDLILDQVEADPWLGPKLFFFLNRSPAPAVDVDRLVKLIEKRSELDAAQLPTLVFRILDEPAHVRLADAFARTAGPFTAFCYLGALCRLNNFTSGEAVATKMREFAFSKDFFYHVVTSSGSGYSSEERTDGYSAGVNFLLTRSSREYALDLMRDLFESLDEIDDDLSHEIIHFVRYLKRFSRFLPKEVLEKTFSAFNNNDSESALHRRLSRRLAGLLTALPTGVMLDWSSVDPTERVPWLAAGLAGDDDDPRSAKLDVSSALLPLLGVAPDPRVVIDALVQKLHPMSGWVGEFAAILRQRAAVIFDLEDHPDPLIAAAARDARARVEEEIRSAEERDRRFSHDGFE